MIRTLITALAIFSVSTFATAEKGDWTIHTVSVHAAASDANNINPGVGYDVTDNVRVGALYNSFKKPAAYAIRLFPITDRIRIGAGVISGYTIKNWRLEGKTTGIIPAVATEIDITKKVSVAWFGHAVNLELKF